MSRMWNVYLSGEIHSNWRQEIIDLCEKRDIPVRLTGPELNHEKSDICGDVILGKEESSFWKDHKSARINQIRNKSVLGNSDIVIVRFGDKYKQWNAAFDAGYCAALGKPYITLHDESIIHALKEVDGSAQAWATSPEQVVEILRYLVSQK